MLAYTYVSKGDFRLMEKPEPVLRDGKDAVVRVELASICTSDLHIKHGAVPRAVPGITVGHEMVGTVETVGSEVTKVKPGAAGRWAAGLTADRQSMSGFPTRIRA